MAKILTISFLYDNNIINGGNRNGKIVWKKIIRLETIWYEKAFNGNSE